MSALLIVIHIIVCIALIMIVLLQTGKGADMGAAFGGGASNTLFGSTGASTFLGKATTAAAIIFMLTSLALAYMSGHRIEGSVMTNVEVDRATQQEGTPPPVTQSTEQGANGQATAPATDGSSPKEKVPAPAPSSSAAPAPAGGSTAGTSDKTPGDKAPE